MKAEYHSLHWSLNLILLCERILIQIYIPQSSLINLDPNLLSDIQYRFCKESVF